MDNLLNALRGNASEKTKITVIETAIGKIKKRLILCKSCTKNTYDLIETSALALRSIAGELESLKVDKLCDNGVFIPSFLLGSVGYFYNKYDKSIPVIHLRLNTIKKTVGLIAENEIEIADSLSALVTAKNDIVACLWALERLLAEGKVSPDFLRKNIYYLNNLLSVCEMAGVDGESMSKELKEIRSSLMLFYSVIFLEVEEAVFMERHKAPSMNPLKFFSVMINVSGYLKERKELRESIYNIKNSIYSAQEHIAKVVSNINDIINRYNYANPLDGI